MPTRVDQHLLQGLHRLSTRGHPAADAALPAAVVAVAVASAAAAVVLRARCSPVPVGRQRRCHPPAANRRHRPRPPLRTDDGAARRHAALAGRCRGQPFRPEVRPGGAGGHRRQPGADRRDEPLSRRARRRHVDHDLPPRHRLVRPALRRPRLRAGAWSFRPGGRGAPEIEVASERLPLRRAGSLVEMLVPTGPVSAIGGRLGAPTLLEVSG